MMGLFRSLAGLVGVELISADISSLVSLIVARQITLRKLSYVDDITVRVWIDRKDFKIVKEIVKRKGGSLSVYHKEGIYWQFKALYTRPVLWIGVALLLLIAIFLPGRILFIQVQGNLSVPSKMILETADSCGISMFVSRRSVRSEKVKNALLEQMPQLQWAGINTEGCVATICVTEKTAVKDAEPKYQVGNVVASRDGVITEFTVVKGNPLCAAGQVVKTGQTLISGYTDCGIKIQATQAEGEVFARTYHDISMISPVNFQKRTLKKGQLTKFSLKFGKKYIKLYKGSGISDTSCVKMYDEIKLTLPGGFVLPVSLVKETFIQYDCAAFVTDDHNWIIDAAEQYLYSKMIAGQILNQDIQFQSNDAVICLTGRFSCHEMIGRTKKESIIQR